ncbi:DMT family transporter [Streptomonospora salina]|uniref:Quaternary ammonium compound-resistance protein SugE n=1 Tax=Streptomonospora salina TaxID=104205 RepID=A0A841EL64_9ACTN|nr:multidrug efflux SMR transporter [Streptomonospora salina]MBB6001060.1 quaternary ammonium compound-resistance protein SugE [Streptomonospora salina]
MAWAVLIAAGLLEIVWSVALDEAHGLTELWPSVIGIGTALLSLALLSRALRSLPMGTAYAAWVGIGAVGVAAVGTLVLGEPFTWTRAVCIGLIIAGVVGLNAEDGASPRPDRAGGEAGRAA